MSYSLSLALMLMLEEGCKVVFHFSFSSVRAGRQDDDDRGERLRRVLAALPGLLHHRIRLSGYRLLPVHPGR